MLRLIPYRYKTLILPISKEDLNYLLQSVTETPDSRPFYENRDKIDGLVKFKGIVKADSFSISKKSKYHQPFIPLIKGSFENTAANTIVRMTFKPFPATSSMVTIWSVLSILLGCLFIGIHQPMYSGISFVLGLLNYAVALANFRIHTNDAIKDLEQTLSWD